MTWSSYHYWGPFLTFKVGRLPKKLFPKELKTFWGWISQLYSHLACFLDKSFENSAGIEQPFIRTFGCSTKTRTRICSKKEFCSRAAQTWYCSKNLARTRKYFVWSQYYWRFLGGISTKMISFANFFLELASWADMKNGPFLLFYFLNKKSCNSINPTFGKNLIICSSF